MMKTIRGMCALRFSIQGDEATIEIGYVWIMLIFAVAIAWLI